MTCEHSTKGRSNQRGRGKRCRTCGANPNYWPKVTTAVAAPQMRRTDAPAKSKPFFNSAEALSSTATIVQATVFMTEALRRVAQSLAMAVEPNRVFMDAAIQELRMVGRRVSESENDLVEVGAASAPGS